MIVLDEQLKDKHLVAQIAGWYGGHVTHIQTLRPHTIIKDDNIPSLLLTAKQPTFVTINVKDFWRRMVAHRGYCLVTIDLQQEDADMISTILRSLLRLPIFSTRAERMGKVIRVRGVQVQWYGLDRKVVTV
ncbi:MAG: hypothetical protein AAF614_07185 [Chloroflexota bacterium]